MCVFQFTAGVSRRPTQSNIKIICPCYIQFIQPFVFFKSSFFYQGITPLSNFISKRKKSWIKIDFALQFIAISKCQHLSYAMFLSLEAYKEKTGFSIVYLHKYCCPCISLLIHSATPYHPGQQVSLNPRQIPVCLSPSSQLFRYLFLSVYLCIGSHNE